MPRQKLPRHLLYTALFYSYEPIVIKGRLKTHKEDPELHGIGMSSITRALEPYNGVLTWEYNEAEKIFSTKIIIKIFSTEFIMKNALILI